MSISSISTLAIVRNSRVPKKSDIGAAASGAPNASQSPSLADILAKTVPVGLVSLYTAFIAAVTELVKEPTAAKLHPDQFIWVRWVAFIILVLGAAVVTVGSYRKKTGGPARFPMVEVLAVTVAAAAWGLAVPGSPLLASIDDRTVGALVVALIAFAGGVVNLMLSSIMRSQA